jgi:DNA-binding transcriptional MerR regulator
MSTLIQRKSEADQLYPIRTVCGLTGVNPITLRAWERRYGLIQPVRTESGHRLYRQADIDLIHRVLAQLERGIPISQISASLAAPVMAAATSSDTEHPLFAGFGDRLIAAIIRFDEFAIEDAYNEALGLAPIGEVTQHVLLPLLRELGRRWESSEGSVAEEHFFSFYLRNKIGARFHHRPRRPSRGAPPFVAACLPGERHEIGLLLFAIAAHEEGLLPILLGADVPLEELPIVVRRSHARAIVLSGSLTPPDEVLRQALPKLVARAEVPVAIGGRISIEHHDALIAAGAQPLGVDQAHGILRLRALLEPDHNE